MKWMAYPDPPTYTRPRAPWEITAEKQREAKERAELYKDLEQLRICAERLQAERLQKEWSERYRAAKPIAIRRRRLRRFLAEFLLHFGWSTFV